LCEEYTPRDDYVLTVLSIRYHIPFGGIT